MRAYCCDGYLWWRVAEYPFGSFMLRSRTRGWSVVAERKPGLRRRPGFCVVVPQASRASLGPGANARGLCLAKTGIAIVLAEDRNQLAEARAAEEYRS